MAVIRTSNINLQVNGSGAYAYIAEPDDDAQHPGVVVIQEWWGIEPHVRSVAERLAAEGFVVAVPDLYNGKVMTEPNDAMKAVMMIRGNIELAAQKIIGALETLRARPNVEPKKLGLMGFCVGGFLAFTVAARYGHLGALVPFYASSYNPTSEEIARVNAPVLAIYGSEDESISLAQIHKIEHLYKEAGKDLTLKLYAAGHAFLNPDHGKGNQAAALAAWPIAVNFLRQRLA